MDMQGLSMICAGLGVIEEDEKGNRIGYEKGEYCLDNLKDLLRFLRRDDPQTREVFKQVCKWNIVSKDLIPIVENCQNDRNLVLNAVKVLVFLTMPIDPVSNDIPQQVEYLWGLKSAVTCSDTVAVIVSLLESPLENLECGAFSEDDWKLVQLVLTLFRNILAIQDITSQQKVGGSAIQYVSLRDRFIELAFRENVMDLVLVITQHISGSCAYLRQDNFLLLEIFHYICMGQDPELIAKAHLNDPKVDGEMKASFNSLKSIIEEEEEKKKLARLRSVCRHSQFSGTFTRLTMDGSKAVIKGKPSASREPLVKYHNVQQGQVKKIVSEQGRLPSMRSNILKLLHDFLSQFLSGAYNVLMRSVRDDIEKEQHAIQNSDVIIFFQVAHFVTSFQYHKVLTCKPNMERGASEACDNIQADSTYFEGDICGPVAASMNESMFFLVFSKWRNAFDCLKQTNEYKLLSAAGSVMKSMIRMLDLVLKLLPEDSKEPQTARILLYKIFYDQTEEGMTQFLLNLIKSFDSHKQPRSDLADLIEMLHVIVQLMENLQQRGTLRVSKKSRKGRKKKLSMKKKETGDKQPKENVEAGNEAGVLLSEQVVDLDIPVKEGFNSGGLDGKADGSINPQVDVPEAENDEGGLSEPDTRKLNDAEDDLCSDNSESSGDEQAVPINEVDFKVSTLVSAFANNSIIQKLCWLLKFYKCNSLSTNHYIISILRRITEDLELSPMLYQLSLLTTFHEILAEQKSHPHKEYTNIVDFLTNVVRKMLKKMKSQPLLFVEVLFWKTRRECHYINAEYLLNELGNLRKKTSDLENVSGDQEMGSLQDKIWVQRSIADALGEDEADVVLSYGHENKKENKFLGEASDGITSSSGNDINDEEKLDKEGNSDKHGSEKVSRRRRKFYLTEELEIKLKELYEKFKDQWNCSRLIAQELDPDWKVAPAQVANKLKQLGLKVARRKAEHFVGEGRVTEEGSSLHPTNDSGESLTKQPLHTRKRVRAFSVDEEAKIKALFEKFKDHKRCSYMIAKSLDANDTVTAAQVSHKLKQLGLRVSQQKKDRVHLKEQESDDSDMETLISLKNRGKNSLSRSSQEDWHEQRVEGAFTQEISDDETLGTFFRKTKKVCLESAEKLTANPVQGTVDEYVKNRGAEAVSESYEKHRDDNFSGRLEVMEVDEAIDHGVSDNAKADASGKISTDLLDNINDSSLQLEDHDLEDLEEDANLDALPKSPSSRRKLRMVVDFDEDDD